MRKNKSILYITAILIILSLTLTGCSLQELIGNKKKSSSSSSSTNNQKPVIALTLDEENPNRLLIKKGIEDMAKDANMEVKEISPQGNSNSKGNGKKEESPLKGVKVLIYQGSNNQELLQNAEKDKVPILALDSLPPGSKPAGIVLPDPEEAGKLMAETLLSRIKDGKVILMQGDPNDSSSQKMLAGNKQVLGNNSAIQIEVIASPPGTEAGRQILTQILQKDRSIKGIIAHSERLAAQAHETLKHMNLQNTVALVGGEANLESLKRIANGGQIGDIDTSPYIQGVNAFQWAQKIINKQSLDVMESVTGDQGEIPAKVIPVKQVTPENLAVIQKSYSTTITAAQKEEKQKQAEQEKSQKEGNKEQDQEKGNMDNQANEGGQGQQGKENGQSQSNIPPGVKKVTERVKTEITREYLDEQGNILGRETSTNQQVRTVPPEMLQSQQGQPQEKSGDKSKEEGSSGSGGSGGGSGGGK